MAAKRGEVDLVIRAKEAATKAIDAVASAADTLSESLSGLQRDAKKPETALSRLGDAFSKLEKSLGGATVANKISQSLDTAASAADRLRTATAGAQKELGDFLVDMLQATEQTARLKARSDELTLAVAREAKALVEAKAAAASNSATLETAIADRKRLIAAEKDYADRIVEQQKKVDAATAKLAARTAALNASQKPTKAMSAGVDAAASTLERQVATLDDLKATYDQIADSIPKADRAVERYTATTAQANDTLKRQTTILADTKAAFVVAADQASAAAAQQGNLNKAADRAAVDLAREKEALAAAQVELVQFEAATAKASGALGSLSAAVRGPLLKAFGDVKLTVRETQQEWAEAENTVRKLAAEMTAIGPPTRDQAIAWNKATTAAKAAKAEFSTQQEVLHRLRGVLREEATDVDSLKNKIDQFSAILGEGSQRLEQIRADAAQAASAFERLAGSATRATAPIRTLSSGAGSPPVAPVNSLAEAYRKLYGETRLAMSWTQRLRGEVLSLVAAYGGIYGVINILGKVIDTYKTLEATTSRLNVVFDGDQGKAAETMDFLRRTADRLGQSLGVLADEYSKFSVATKGTNLEGEKTRKIFLAVAEAARVNKISNDDLKGVFTALSQIASKGVVQMEELRQQLGDRLTGAVQIMAAGLGVGTDELFDMTKNAEVTSDALVNFADELTKRFGPALAKSLLTTTTQLGALQNATFQAMKTFGEAGFIDSFTNLLKSLNEVLRSADFQAFTVRLSQGVAKLTDVLSFLVQNFRAVGAAMAALLAIRIAPFVTALSSAFLALTGILPALRTGVAASVIAVDGLARSMPIAASAAARLTLAFRALLSSTGIGLLITAISVGISLWATRADEATVALNAHQKVVDQVKNSYDKTGKSAAEWAKEIQKVSLTEAIERLRVFRQELDNLRASAKVPVDAFGDLANNETFRNVQNLVRMFQKGEIVAEDFRKQIDELAQTDPSFNRGLAISFIQIAEKAGDAETKIEETLALIKLVSDPADKAARAVLGLGDAFEGTNKELDDGADKLQRYLDAIKELTKSIPELAQQAKLLEDLGKNLSSIGTAFSNATNLSQILNAGITGARAITATLSEDQAAVFKEIAANTQVTQELFQQIIGHEGFRSQAYPDSGGTPTIGFGSTRLGNRAVQMGDVVNAQQAMAQAVRDLDTLLTQINALVKVPLSKAQLNALTSYAYNVGIGSFAKSDILKTLNSGDYLGTAKALANGVATVNGQPNEALRARRLRESTQFANGIDDPKVLAEVLATEQKRTEEAAKLHEELAKNNEQSKFELSIEKDTIVQQEVSKALREAENKAKAAGTTLTEQERQAIIDTTTAKYAEASANKVLEDQRKSAQEAEQKVNDLLSQQKALEEQLKVYKANGDTTAVDATQMALRGVNDQLLAAIDNAIKMWEAVGGTGAASAIAQLKSARLAAQGLKADAGTVIIDWKRVGEMFASGLTNAVSKFANAIAEGKSATEAFKEAFLQFAADFLQQIAQMIIQALILKALNSVFPGMGFGGAAVPVAHGGAIVGQPAARTRMLGAGVLAAVPYMPRMHTGAIVGLSPDETMAVLQKNEEVLSKESPRNILNGGAAASPGGRPVDPSGYIKNIVAIGEDQIAQAMSGRAGDKVFLTWAKANAPAIRKIIGAGG